MKPLIITEAGNNIGFGHLTRCISLYEAFEERGVVPVFAVNSDNTVEGLLKGKDYQLFNWLQDRDGLSELLKYSSITIIDSYVADPAFYRYLSEAARILVCIDDTNRIDYPKGVVINGSIYAENLSYPNSADIRYFLGSRFTPLRKQFWDMRKKRIKENIKNIMVTFGGDDSKDMEPRVLKFLNKKYPSMHKDVIIGKAFKDTSIDKLRELADRNTTLLFNSDSADMQNIMLASDIAISSGGQTLYELAATGVPTIGVCVAENQLLNLKEWHKKGFVEHIGWYYSDNLEEDLSRAINRFQPKRERMLRSKIGMRLIDGQGPRRIVEKLLAIYSEIEEAHVKIRDAGEGDINELFDWRNHPDVRKNFFNTAPVSRKEHETWFYTKVNDAESSIYMAFLEDEKIGSIRFETEDAAIKVSVMLNPAFFNRGLGSKVITEGIKRFMNTKAPTKPILAHVKKSNIASIKVFTKAGFTAKDTSLEDAHDSIKMYFNG